MFDSDIASAFKAQLSPKQRARLETSFNVAGTIADAIATFKGQQSTSESHVYKGNLTVLVNSDDRDYHVYRVKPLVFGNQVLNERFLIKTPGIAFTTKDLRMFGENCTIRKKDLLERSKGMCSGSELCSRLSRMEFVN